MSPALRRPGFILVSTLLAVLVLTAAGLLIFIVSTRDIRVSSRAVGGKKAFSAAQSGAHRLTEKFAPADPTASAVNREMVDPANDPDSLFSTSAPAVPRSGPGFVEERGFSGWGRTRYVAALTGENTRYQTSMEIRVGIGFGPVEGGTTYR